MGIVRNGNFELRTQTLIDERYGPYATTAAAKLAVTDYRALGLTVGIETGGVVTEWWWKNGVTDNDLVEKLTVDTDNLTNNSVTLPKLDTIDNLKVLGNVSGSTANVTEVVINNTDSMSDASATTLATSASIKAYVNPTIQTLTFGNPLVIAFNNATNYLTITLTGNTTFSTVSGVVVGKEYLLFVDNNEPTYPYQITFGAGYSIDDGVVPLLKSKVSGTLDIIKMVGITTTKLQIVDVIYGS